MNTSRFEIIGLENMPAVTEGASLSGLIAAHSLSPGLADGDVLVVASKVVSLSEGQFVDLKGVTPTREAVDLARLVRKDPRIVEVILRESSAVRLATASGPIVAWHRLGFELTSAGVDRLTDDIAVVLPRDPDASARQIRGELYGSLELTVAVVIADSDGRPDRKGATAVSIGSAGISPLRVTPKPTGEGIQEETLVDLVAAAAAVVIGQRGRGVPVAVVRGLRYEASDSGVRSILHRRV